jgi:hypothetical protein
VSLNNYRVNPLVAPFAFVFRTALLKSASSLLQTGRKTICTRAHDRSRQCIGGDTGNLVGRLCESFGIIHSGVEDFRLTLIIAFENDCK